MVIQQRIMLVFLLSASTALAQAGSVPMPAMPGMPTQAPPPLTASPAAPAAPSTIPQATVPQITLPTVAVPAGAAAIPPSAAPALPVNNEALPKLERAAPEEFPASEPAVPAAFDASINEDGADYSYGVINYSLMYRPEQISRMKSVLTILENARRNPTNTQIQVIENAPAAAAPIIVEEPAAYPVYTLKSIAFRNNRDWTVWIGDMRITPARNDQEVRVIGVGPNMAQFLWKPIYDAALKQRGMAKKFEDPAAVKHKLTRPNTANFDSENGQVSFTLRPNQSFVPGYMATFEGKVPSPPLSKISDEEAVPGMEEALTSAPAGGVAAPSTSASDPANLDALLRAQQQAPLGGMVRGQPNRNQPAAPAPTSAPASAPVTAPATVPGAVPAVPQTPAAGGSPAF